MDTGCLLSVEPQELQFPFEVKKQISCSLLLLNKSENYVAFKVMTTNPKKYCVRPNVGVVSPRSTCDVTVTMQAQKKAPPNMQCKDKFLVQSVVASRKAAAKDVNAEMFNKEAGHLVEECKLKVVYVASPGPPSPVREGSEEGSSPRASVSDDGSLSASVQSGLEVDPTKGSSEWLLTAFPSGMSSNIGPTQYSYEQLSKATGHFSNDYILGQGGFGQVFKGALHGEILAIKKLNYFQEQTREELVHEIAIINSVRHCNLVKLLGYCIEGANALLVLEYCLNKSLRFHLHGGGKEILDWPTRRKIAIGSAKGLEYLHEHSSPKIIHRDIKPDNILLDINFEPKIADFGLALFFPDTVTHLSRSIAGTEVYIDPEHSGRISSKSDVYSFGVVLLELITGRKPKYQGIDIVSWAKTRITQALNGQYIDFVDSNLQSYDRSEMEWMISCTAACVYNPFKSRPQMKEVVRVLEGYSPAKDKAGTLFIG
ncbi:proline-rich receptor-like protein kinase PERK3 isoform X1 [Hevea brasiliensis]|uniref:proline-rich receptor-like protein kinase PERK3 isoform X1 n=1 Tax=Hevea brasiliensis TaxID=3981 RepID=UPI0025DA6534|nr:proline-rich receptor-like protein kinase PERK3 isoform X1 [Hevea brasiliensis]